MGFIEIAMLVLIAIIVITKGLLIYRKRSFASEREIGEDYIATLTRAIIHEASIQTFSISMAIRAVKSGTFNSVSIRRINTRVEKGIDGKVKVKLDRKKVILTSQDVIVHVLKEVGDSLPGLTAGAIANTIFKHLDDKVEISGGELLIYLSAALDENTTIEEI